MATTNPVATYNTGSIDWHSLVDAIIQAESVPLANLQAVQSADRTRKSIWGSYGSTLDTLKDKTDALRDADIRARSVNVGSTTTGVTPFAATATADAKTGSHTIQVKSLARVETWGSGAQPSSSDALGYSGSFTLNGKSITVAAGDSLETLRDQINRADAGVEASVLQTKTNSYTLVLRASEAGKDGIVVDDPDATGVVTDLGLAQKTVGSDAYMIVDGNDVYRKTNTIDDALAGVTFNLAHETGTETVDMTIQSDKSGVKQSVKDWIKAVNDAHGFYLQQRTPASSPDAAAPPLHGDSTLRMADQKITAAMRASLSDNVSSADARNLAQIGITISKDGVYSMNESKFDDAFDADPEAVAAVFDGAMSATNSHVTIVSRAVTTKPGDYAVEVMGDGTVMIGGKAAKAAADGYVGADGTDTAGLFFRLDSLAPGTYGVIHVEDGAARSLSNALSDINGYGQSIISTAKDNLDNRIAAEDKRATRMQDALDRRRAALNAQYLAMQQMMQKMQQQGSAMSGMFG